MDEVEVEVVDLELVQRFPARCTDVIGMMVGTPQLKKDKCFFVVLSCGHHRICEIVCLAQDGLNLKTVHNSKEKKS